jgi:hypothetical protein
MVEISTGDESGDSYFNVLQEIVMTVEYNQSEVLLIDVYLFDFFTVLVFSNDTFIAHINPEVYGD